ncbi:MAG: NAD(P)-dependent oxidoreductase [Deltaproteobacteria bacterium]|nr:NAD(P)-dependent oxidoreductase [Deltaproteobacteria bacterium]
MENNIGVIGIGNMGFGMSCNLLEAGFNVYVYDVRPEPLEEMKKRGAVAASGVVDLAQKCPVVFSVLLDYQQNLSVIDGPQGLVKNMKQGGCIFVCSTISPLEARELHRVAKANGIRLLDCPISGGPEGARAGTLSLMIGGDTGAVTEHRKALEAISANIYHFGDVGAGESAKAINQLLVAVNNVATDEAMLLASKSGLNLKEIYNLISNSAGNSWIFQHRAMRMIEHDFKPRGILGILLKDTSIVTKTAASLKLVLPITTLVQQLYQAGVNAGFGSMDDSAIVRVLETLSSYSIIQQPSDKPESLEFKGSGGQGGK